MNRDQLMNPITFPLVFIIIGAFFLPGARGFAESGQKSLSLMPVPEKVVLKDGAFRVTDEFTAAIDGPGGSSPGSRVHKAVRRMLARLAGRTGFFFKNNDIRVNAKPGKDALRVSFKRMGKPELYEDESYHLEVNPVGVRLTAETGIGVLRGLETVLQLLSGDKEGYYLPAVVIDDKPRFAWRGLLIDSCRHFMPVEVIKRNLDGMAAVKMNVMHWHLTEDQGFRVECRSFPKLHQMGSDGMYYRHRQIKEIIAYAADRGIRVMPEFDIPGHSTSWLIGYPELGSGAKPASIERGYGVKDPTFNPAIKATYKFFDRFFKEMAALFPDDYMHIGGDENNGKEWDANPGIQAFKKKHNLEDNHALQAYFNGKILKILTKNGKKMVGWDEVFRPGLPKTIVIQSWRGKEALGEAAKKGYKGILSNGYYIDLSQSTEFHYLNDPIPVDSDLTEEERKRILGGEATMWAELVSPETIDSRIWPRTAAIAERFWSAASVNDVRDMYRRLDIIGLQLEELGLNHWKNQAMMLRRLTGGMDTSSLQVLVDVMEPLKIYNRHRQGVTYTFYSPLTRVVDAALPDARVARNFGWLTADFIKNKGPKDMEKGLLNLLETWKGNHEKLLPVIEQSPVLNEIATLSGDLSKIAVIGIEAIGYIRGGKVADREWVEASQELLKAAKAPGGHGELVVVTAIEQLVKQSMGTNE
ncbi:MAG: family 20 glycosylhydrolase [bacterium]|nr:family 20 glycosylhydrolase [bacterium]